MSKYPELDKLSNNVEELSAITSFLNFLDENEYVVGKWHQANRPLAPPQMVECSIKQLIHAYFGVDTKQYNKEFKESIEDLKNTLKNEG